MDVDPARYYKRRIIRRKFVRKDQPELAPVIAPLQPRLIEGDYASAGLLVDIILKKFVDHLPLYRQERILKTRYGIDLSRKTMCEWMSKVADWLTPIYNQTRDELRSTGYLQVDETPVRYCGADGGGGGQGYLWAYLPQSRTGKAIGYALSQWGKLERFCEDGRIEIDNNLVENAIRPTALGKKNWLFFGSPDAGQRAAIIYTLLESCRRHGINPRDYLHDVLTRLPAMKITEVADLTPGRWLAAKRTTQHQAA